MVWHALRGVLGCLSELRHCTQQGCREIKRWLAAAGGEGEERGGRIFIQAFGMGGFNCVGGVFVLWRWRFWAVFIRGLFYLVPCVGYLFWGRLFFLLRFVLHRGWPHRSLAVRIVA